jgi:hypothetical protein
MGRFIVLQLGYIFKTGRDYVRFFLMVAGFFFLIPDASLSSNNYARMNILKYRDDILWASGSRSYVTHT